MKSDNIEVVLREALTEEVSSAAHRLEGLEERIVHELGDRCPRPRVIDRLREILAPTKRGQIGQLVVLGATAAIFLSLGLMVARDRQGVPTLTPALAPTVATSRANHEVLFVVPAIGADAVAVVGDFNGWEETPLDDDNQDGIWTASIPLSPGRYEYAFVIDGRWWGQDPSADEYVQTFGQYSSVRYVGSGGDGV